MIALVHPDVPDRPPAPERVHQVAYAFFDEVTRLLGNRLGESRFDADRGLRVTVIDLTDDDHAAIRSAAAALEIEEWVRIERADPDDLTNWERLRHDLLRLTANHGTLQSSPTPEPGYRRPPVEITLFAHAQSVASDLHATYGDFVALQVGTLAYPPSHTTEPPRAPAGSRAPTDPNEMTIELNGPLAISSGHHVTHAVLLGNHSDHDITVETNGTITADVLDDDGTVDGRRLTSPPLTFTVTS